MRLPTVSSRVPVGSSKEKSLPSRRLRMTSIEAFVPIRETQACKSSRFASRDLEPANCSSRRWNSFQKITGRTGDAWLDHSDRHHWDRRICGLGHFRRIWSLFFILRFRIGPDCRSESGERRRKTCRCQCIARRKVRHRPATHLPRTCHPIICAAAAIVGQLYFVCASRFRNSAERSSVS